MFKRDRTEEDVKEEETGKRREKERGGSLLLLWAPRGTLLCEIGSKSWKCRYWFIYKTLQTWSHAHTGWGGTRATDTQHYFTKPIIHRAITQTDRVHFKKLHTHAHTCVCACVCIAQSHISVWFVLILWVQWAALNLLTETPKHQFFTALGQLPVLLRANKDGARVRWKRDGHQLREKNWCEKMQKKIERKTVTDVRGQRAPWII